MLLDIEGTTTPLAFVQEVLFPFARTHLGAWLAAHRETSGLAAIAAALRAEHAVDRAQGDAVPAWDETTSAARIGSVERYVGWLMDRDRKSPALKTLQGLIWEDGFQSGVLRGQVYADVADALRRWHRAGLVVAIYSSGSELAQRRLFASTAHGDLSPYIAAYFDTAVGAKRERASYARIAAAMGLTPGAILFLSDVPAELEAARAAGLQVVLTVRPGNPVVPEATGYQRVATFDELT